MFALADQFLVFFGFKVSVRRASAYPLAPKAEKVTKKRLPKTAMQCFNQFMGSPFSIKFRGKMNFESILKQQIKNTRFYQRKWSLSDTYGPEKPHKIIVGSFKNTVSTTFQKVAPGRGPELHFGCFWASKIRQNSKKCSPKRNRKNDLVPGAHKPPTGGEGGSCHFVLWSGPRRARSTDKEFPL